MKTHKPTKVQAAWLRRIARNPLMKTYVVDNAAPQFSLLDGTEVPPEIATILIRNGWVRGRQDGLWGDQQTYGIPKIYDALRP